jgi:hypothetical protein
MKDVLDIIKNIESIYSTNSSLSTLKDFERVLDELDLYVYENWIDGELVEGPIVKRHWVKASFMWPRTKMPDPMGAKRLLDYGCKIQFERSHLVEPKKIKSPEDFRTGTRKGKLEKHPIWIVHITIPKDLVSEIYDGYMNHMRKDMGIGRNSRVDGAPSQTADQTAIATGAVPAAQMPMGDINAPA